MSTRVHFAAFVVAALALLLGACGASEEVVGQSPNPTATSAPTTAPVASPTEVVAPTVAAATPTPAAAPDPTATAVPDPTAIPEAQPEPTVAASADPQELFFPGLLEDQYCVVDIVAPDTLNVRAGPSTDTQILAMLGEGECRLYRSGDQVDGWVEIVADRADAQVQGWVSAKYIEVLRASVDPNTPTVVITVTVEFGFGRPEQQPAIDAFQLVDEEGLTVGLLDANGQIAVPTNLDLNRVMVTAEWANDRFCAWTGTLQFEGSDNRYNSELEALCA